MLCAPIDPIFVLDEEDAKTAAACVVTKKKKPFLFIPFNPFLRNAYYANFNVFFFSFANHCTSTHPVRYAQNPPLRVPVVIAAVASARSR